MEWYSYFPSIVCREEHPEWVEPTLQAVQKYYHACSSDAPMCQTGPLYQDKNLRFLTDYLLEAATQVLAGQGYDVHKYDLYLSGLWGQEIHGNGGTNVHIHKNSQVCGWFFLETPEGGSYPVYHDPRMNKAMAELDYTQGAELNAASAYVHFNNVIPGTVLISNSWMHHQLTPNTSSKPTKAVHFIVSHREKGHTCSM